jgi:site-specific DNA-methyltransferase (adenine-specific)
MKKIDPNTMYSTEEFANFLNVSLITAKRYIKNDIIYSSKIGGIRRIKGEDILNLINNEKKVTSSPTLKNGVQFYWSQKSAQVAFNLYKKYCKDGDIVMDPFLGAGSSLYGTKDLNLKFIGVEINEMPINIVKFNCQKNSEERINNLYSKINAIQKKLGYLYEYKTNNGQILNLSKIVYRTLPPISPADISMTLIDSNGKIRTEKDFPELATQHIARYKKIEVENKKTSKTPLTKNSRIAIKSNMFISDIFSPINFYILTEIKKTIKKDPEMKFILGSVLHLLRLTDIRSQSQFPYWVPKKDILDRNMFNSLSKKVKELNNYIDNNETPVYSNFNDFKKSKNGTCYLLNKPIQNLSGTDIPDESVDFILTDPPYYDQVAYSEYLKIWEYFIETKSFFKDEIIQSQRVVATSREEDYLKNLGLAFSVIRSKLKNNGKMFVYFKDSRPEKIQKFLETMSGIGLEFVNQEHIEKSKYTYKQNTTSETTVTGDCIMQFTKKISLEQKTGEVDELNMVVIQKTIKDYVKTYLLINKSATIGELYDNGLLKILYENHSLNMLKNTKEVNDIIHEFCKYDKDQRKFSLNETPLKDELLCGDCIAILKSIPDCSVDCCITDPPYNISGYDDKKEIGWYKSNKLWAEKKKFNKIDAEWDKFSDSNYHDFTLSWINEIKRILKPNGNIAIFGSIHNIYRIGAILEDLDIKTINSIVWFKRNAFPNITQRMFCESTEQIIWATNNSKKHAKNWTFNYKTMKEMNGGKQMRNMWDIPSTPQKERKFGKHPSQKPEEVLDRLVKALTNDGDIIIDPFLGSGTTAVMAKKNNRHFIGIDMDMSYLDIAKKRLSI